MDRNVVETIENIFREKIINREYDSYLKSVDSELLFSLSLSLRDICREKYYSE